MLVTLSSCYLDAFEEQTHSYNYRNEIVGRYDIDEYSDTYHEYTYYSVSISEGYGRREIYINNFYGQGLGVVAYVDGSQIEIPFQVVDGFEIEGIGLYRHNKIEFHYSVSDRYNHGYTDYCDTEAFRVRY
jgi:hypothetical protein